MHAGSRARTCSLLVSALAACGGTIEFQSADSSITAPSPDGGAPDGGARAEDAAAADAAAPTPDAGACTPRTRPPVPTTWPYPVTAAAFTARFVDAIPAGMIPCSSAACHNGPRPPYIPDAAALATPANVTRAVSELWQAALPAAGGGPSLLRRRHAADGDNVAPVYLPGQVTAIEMFEQLAYDCAWKAAPAPGPDECPAPDVSYCDR